LKVGYSAAESIDRHAILYALKFKGQPEKIHQQQKQQQQTARRKKHFLIY